MHVCMYVCMYARMCMYVCTYVCIYVCTQADLHFCSRCAYPAPTLYPSFCPCNYLLSCLSIDKPSDRCSCLPAHRIYVSVLTGLPMHTHTPYAHACSTQCRGNVWQSVALIFCLISIPDMVKYPLRPHGGEN